MYTYIASQHITPVGILFECVQKYKTGAQQISRGKLWIQQALPKPLTQWIKPALVRKLLSLQSAPASGNKRKIQGKKSFKNFGKFLFLFSSVEFAICAYDPILIHRWGLRLLLCATYCKHDGQHCRRKTALVRNSQELQT